MLHRVRVTSVGNSSHMLFFRMLKPELIFTKLPISVGRAPVKRQAEM